MPPNLQNLLIVTLAALSVVELAVCLIFVLLGARTRSSFRVQSLASKDTPDPFFTWMNVLERQSDRRQGPAYNGVERRSSPRRPTSLRNKCPQKR